MAAAVEFLRVKYCLMFGLLLISLSLKEGTSRSLSKEPPIKTIHTEWGDILDCVDINKQPAFDHPLLKDHKIQMKPSFSLKDDEKSQRDEQSYKIFKLSDEECPEGTVPILRTHKESSIKDDFQIRSDGHSLAGLRYDVTGETFFGAYADLNVYNPKLTSEDQLSSAEIAVENGPDGIRVGWTVNPSLYGDHNTRIFTIWTNNNYQRSCNDAGGGVVGCSGFVQLNPSVHPGTPVVPTSVLGGLQARIVFQVYKDKLNGNWWLELQDNITVGYWPKELFGSLNGGANQIYWGGNVKKSANGISPEMGSGRIPKGHNYGWACDFQHLKYVDGTSNLLNPKENFVKYVVECSGVPICSDRYGVTYYGFQKEGDFGHTFLFGGPGGQLGA